MDIKTIRYSWWLKSLARAICKPSTASRAGLQWPRKKRTSVYGLLHSSAWLAQATNWNESNDTNKKWHDDTEWGLMVNYIGILQAMLSPEKLINKRPSKLPGTTSSRILAIRPIYSFTAVWFLLRPPELVLSSSLTATTWHCNRSKIGRLCS